MTSIYKSLLLHPAKSLSDRRLKHLQNICAQLREYHPTIKRKGKRNKVLTLAWKYETLLETIELKLR